MVRRINDREGRTSLGQMIERVHADNDQYLIERAGRAMAAVVPVWQLKAWRARRARFFGMVSAAQRKNRGLASAVIAREVGAAVKAAWAPASRPRA